MDAQDQLVLLANVDQQVSQDIVVAQDLLEIQVALDSLDLQVLLV